MDGQNSILSVVGPLATNVASLKLLTKTVLGQEPWLSDPMVHEIPWRNSKETEPKGKKLSFGVIRSDGHVNPMPPVRRAVDTLIQKLQNVGHEVIEWDGPDHEPIANTGANTWVFDGGADVRSAFALSGEPLSKQIEFFSKLDKEFTGSEIAANNVKQRQLKKEYLDYWNSTATMTSTGRPVDAIICPLAPFPAARRERYSYYAYTTWVNVLDYTSVVVPVTNVDKAIDRKDEAYKALNEVDARIQDDCKFSFGDSFVVASLVLMMR